MIRFIIHTVSSKIDVYGNRYHLTQFTSTATGKSLQVEMGGEDNANFALRRLLELGWEDFHSSHADLPIREFNRLAKNNDHYEHRLTAEMLTALEVSNDA